MPKTALSTIAEFTAGTTYRDIPSDVIHQAKRIILDTIGCAFAGYATETGRAVRKVARDLGGKPQCTIIVSGEKTSCGNSAFVNERM